MGTVYSILGCGTATPPAELHAEDPVQLSLPAIRRSGPLPPEVMMMILERIPDKFDRWQAAAGMALVGVFGPAPRTFLEPFWHEEAERPLMPVLGVHQAPFETSEALENAAFVAGLIPRPRAVLPKAQDMALAQRVPQSVPLSVVRAMQGELRRRLVVSALEAQGLGAFWTRPSLCDRDKLEYIRCGSPDLPTLVAQLRREAELTASLAERGLTHPPVYINSMDEIAEYVTLGKGGVSSIVNHADEARFYDTCTKFRTLILIRMAQHLNMNPTGSLNGNFPSDEDIKEAREQAWSDVVKNRGRGWLLALPELPLTLRQRLEAEYTM